ncbi:MAG: prephenate dehydrogenase/arogenate dehydrogenase family protein [Anaerolineae bacterium]
MSKFTITIIGAGVIGTSLGLALKQQDDPPILLAHDKDLGVASAAAKLGAFDKAEWNLINACEKADLVILAIPLSGVEATLKAIGPELKPNAVVTDTCPSKQPVLAWAAEHLPDSVHFVGGNPLVRPPGSGAANARADLFRERLYCLTPAPGAHEEAVELLVGLASLVGAEPFFLDPAEHDGLATAVEHLPRLLSVALMRTLATPGSWREIRKMAGGTFEQISAGAEGDPDGIKDNFVENREMLLHWLDSTMAELGHLRGLLSGGNSDSGEALAQAIDEAVVNRRDWLKEYRQGHIIEPELAAMRPAEIPGFWQRWLGFGSMGKKRGDDQDKRR